jgi:hypothetical protein
MRSRSNVPSASLRCRLHLKEARGAIADTLAHFAAAQATLADPAGREGIRSDVVRPAIDEERDGIPLDGKLHALTCPLTLSLATVSGWRERSRATGVRSSGGPLRWPR